MCQTTTEHRREEAENDAPISRTQIWQGLTGDLNCEKKFKTGDDTETARKNTWWNFRKKRQKQGSRKTEKDTISSRWTTTSTDRAGLFFQTRMNEKSAVRLLYAPKPYCNELDGRNRPGHQGREHRQQQILLLLKGIGKTHSGLPGLLQNIRMAGNDTTVEQA